MEHRELRILDMNKEKFFRMLVGRMDNVIDVLNFSLF